MQGRIICATLMLVVAPALAQGRTIGEANRSALETYRVDVSDAPVLAQTDVPLPLHGDGGVHEFTKKSTVRAFASSLIIPGLGQLYTGSKVKAAVFFGVELLGWAGYIHFRKQGDQRTSEYQAFADEHWDYNDYWDGLETYGNGDTSSIPRWRDGDYFPHHLPYTINEQGDTIPDKNNEYYENIGKYNQFIWGWDDRAPNGDNSPNPEFNWESANRQIYLDARAQANSSYDKARTAGIVLIANHLISAIDAGLAAGRHNRKAEHARKLSFRIKVLNIEDSPSPWVNLAYRF